MSCHAYNKNKSTSHSHTHNVEHIARRKNHLTSASWGEIYFILSMDVTATAIHICLSGL